MNSQLVLWSCRLVHYSIVVTTMLQRDCDNSNVVLDACFKPSPQLRSLDVSVLQDVTQSLQPLEGAKLRSLQIARLGPVAFLPMRAALSTAAAAVCDGIADVQA